MNTAQAVQRTRDVLRRQHKALSTEDTYIFWLRRYMTAVFSGRMPSISGNQSQSKPINTENSPLQAPLVADYRSLPSPPAIESLIADYLKC